jgi:A/G-specific adenine glycosylase
LLRWFKLNSRDLPWRRTRSPYAIWVSEIMLQQTQVQTVIPYWRRWMRRFPTIRSLARADSDQVLKLWEGLGYYTRARNLHAAARRLVLDRNGRFPGIYDEILNLPGVGRYTAGAICSIAFNQPVPILDGNIIRVLTRLYGIRTNPRKSGTNKRLWNLATAFVQEAAQIQCTNERNCSNINQALMELGATVCTPKQPACAKCPVQLHCVARREKKVADIPKLSWRPSPIEQRVATFVVGRKDRVLARRRPEGVVNARLWEFPNASVSQKSGNGSLGVRGEDLGLPDLNLNSMSLEHVLRFKHAITRHRITVDVYRVKVDSRFVAPNGGGRFLSLAKLDAYPFASAHRKIARHLQSISGGI